MRSPWRRHWEVTYRDGEDHLWIDRFPTEDQAISRWKLVTAWIKQGLAFSELTKPVYK